MMKELFESWLMFDQWLHSPHSISLYLVMGIAGVLGSVGHCAGMCGPIVLSFGVSQSEGGGPSKIKHGLFQLGRITTYALLGGVAGYFGSYFRLQSVQEMAACCQPTLDTLSKTTLWPWQWWVKVLIGFSMMTFGLFLTLGRRADALMEFPLPKKISDFLSRGLKFAHQPYLLGMIWGLIPCGLVYLMLLKSLEFGTWQQGALGMTAFGFGNLPLLFTMGILSSKLSQQWRTKLLRWAGLLIALMGFAILWQAFKLMSLVASGTP